jgi:hypothetical protein
MSIPPAKPCALDCHLPLNSYLGEEFCVVSKILCDAKRLAPSNAEALHRLGAAADFSSSALSAATAH